MKLALRRFDLPLQHAFGIARGTKTVQPTVIVELGDGTQRGYGEAVAYEYYGASVETIVAAVESVRSLLAEADPDDPQGLSDQLAEPLAGSPFARCAIDEAAWDLAGKRARRPVHGLWGLSIDAIPPSSYTIGIAPIDEMVAKLAERPGWPVYKVKLGTPDDIAIIRALREHTDARFRVDANCGWSVAEAIEYSSELAALGVEFIEQPLPAGDLDGTRQVAAGSALPIIADESCVAEADVDRCAGVFDGINIKLTKCGGLTVGRRMAERARELGLQVMVGCMTESSVGISAAAQLLPLVDYADLDGAVLLAEDIAAGVSVDRGRVTFPPVNGTGVRM